VPDHPRSMGALGITLRASALPCAGGSTKEGGQRYEKQLVPRAPGYSLSMGRNLLARGHNPRRRTDAVRVAACAIFPCSGAVSESRHSGATPSIEVRLARSRSEVS